MSSNISDHPDQFAAIVTGSGRGLGRAISLRLSKESPVIAISRTATDLENVSTESGHSKHRVVACVGDIVDPATAVQAIDMARERGWTIRHLVCNAGIGKSGPTAEFDIDAWRRIFDVNVHSCFQMVRACLPELTGQSGATISIISSVAGTSGVAYDAAYTASKHALVGFARSLTLELGKKGITVAALCPSYFESDMTTRTIRGVMRRHGLTEAEATRRVAERCPARRILPAEEVAEAVYLTGAGRYADAVELAATGGYEIIGGPAAPIGELHQ